MTGALGNTTKAVEETVKPTIDLAKANDDLASHKKRLLKLKAMRMVIPQKEIYSLFNELFFRVGTS